MKKLILLRHGKAADHWEDWARPLSTKGKEEVRGVTAKLLTYKDALPQLVICSEAERTKQTFGIFSEGYSNKDFKTVFVQTLYHGSIHDVVRRIGQTGEDVNNLMVIGHNPVLSELASSLSQEQIPLGTSNAVILKARSEEKSWEQLMLEGWNLETLLTPD